MNIVKLCTLPVCVNAVSTSVNRHTPEPSCPKKVCRLPGPSDGP